MATKRSPVWQHFVAIPDENKALCKLCEKSFAYKNGSTKGLSDHLSFKHPDAVKSLDGPPSKRPKITDFLERKTDKQLEEEEEEKIAAIMVRRNESFSFVEDSGIKELISRGFKRIRSLSQSHFKRVVIPRMAEKFISEIVRDIGRAPFAMTSDGWDKPSIAAPLLSITVHFVTESFERRDAVLDV